MNAPDAESMRRREAAITAAIGARIRALRLAAGIRQEDLAGALGLERVVLSRYERGRRSIPYAVLIDVAQVLQQPIAALLPAGQDRGAAGDGAASSARGNDAIAVIASILQLRPDLISPVVELLETSLAPHP